MLENPAVLQSQIFSIDPSAEKDHKLLLLKNLSLTIPVKDQESHLEIIQSVLDQLSGPVSYTHLTLPTNLCV